MLKSAIGEKVKKRRKELGLSQEELAKRMGYKSRSSINKLEMNENDLPQTKVVLLAEALGVPVSYLIDDEPTQLQIYEIAKVKLPMLGTIACGQPIFADQDRESYVLAGTNINADFCLKAQGDSMINARIYDGDIIFIRKQDLVNDGEIAAVIIDDTATLKRFYYYKEQNMVVLRAENPSYKDLIFVNDEINKIRVLGKAVAFQSDVR